MWDYDDLYRLTGESWTGGSVEQARTYSYDKAGNRLSQTIDPAVGSTVTTDYEYDDLNQLLELRRTRDSDRASPEGRSHIAGTSLPSDGGDA